MTTAEFFKTWWRGIMIVYWAGLRLAMVVVWGCSLIYLLLIASGNAEVPERDNIALMALMLPSIPWFLWTTRSLKY